MRGDRLGQVRHGDHAIAERDRRVGGVRHRHDALADRKRVRVRAGRQRRQLGPVADAQAPHGIRAAISEEQRPAVQREPVRCAPDLQQLDLAAIEIHDRERARALQRCNDAPVPERDELVRPGRQRDPPWGVWSREIEGDEHVAPQVGDEEGARGRGCLRGPRPEQVQRAHHDQQRGGRRQRAIACDGAGRDRHPARHRRQADSLRRPSSSRASARRSRAIRSRPFRSATSGICTQLSSQRAPSRGSSRRR